MKIFGWMKNKINGKEGSNYKLNQELMNHHVMHKHCEEEFNDWPNTLLAIGTFGNSNVRDSEQHNIHGSLSLPSSQDHLEYIITPEDFGEVDRDKALRLLLNQHIFNNDASFSGELQKPDDLSLEKFLDSLSEDNRTIDESMNAVSEKKDCHLQQTTSVVRGREGKYISLDTKKNGLGKKSWSFLLKKAFLCKSGFVPNPILRDQIPEPKLDNSRMDKILRAFLHKKVYPQRSSTQTTSKKYLDMYETDSDDKEQEEAGHGSKWVKTDSECKCTTYFCTENCGVPTS